MLLFAWPDALTSDEQRGPWTVVLSMSWGLGQIKNLPGGREQCMQQTLERFCFHRASCKKKLLLKITVVIVTGRTVHILIAMLELFGFSGCYKIINQALPRSLPIV